MYTISPMSIYLLGLSNNLTSILLVGAIVLFILALYSWVEINNSLGMSRNAKSKYLNISKKCIVASIVMILVWVLIPRKQTIIHMLIAKNITVDSVQISSEVVEKVYNDIISVLNK